MRHIKFLSKDVTICSREEEGFDCNNNHECGKSANFWLDKIRKFNCRTLIVLLYILSKL